MTINSTKQPGNTGRPVKGNPESPAFLHGDVPFEHPMPRSDGSLKISTNAYFRLFEGATDIPSATKVLVLFGAFLPGGYIKIFVGDRATYTYSHPGHPTGGLKGYWSFPFSTEENIDILVEPGDDGFYGTFAIR